MQLKEKCLDALCKIFMESFQKWSDSDEGCMAVMMLGESKRQILLAMEQGVNEDYSKDIFFVLNKDGLEYFVVSRDKSAALQGFLTPEKKIIPYIEGVLYVQLHDRNIGTIVSNAKFFSPKEIQSLILKQLDILATDIISPETND